MTANGDTKIQILIWINSMNANNDGLVGKTYRITMKILINAIAVVVAVESANRYLLELSKEDRFTLIDSRMNRVKWQNIMRYRRQSFLPRQQCTECLLRFHHTQSLNNNNRQRQCKRIMLIIIHIIMHILP